MARSAMCPRRPVSIAAFVAICLVVVMSGSASADGAHHGAADPTTEGWTVPVADSLLGASSVLADPQFPAVSATEVDGSAGTLRYQESGPAPGAAFHLRVRMRVVDVNDSTDGNVQLAVRDGATEWAARFGSNASGDTLAEFVGLGSHTLFATNPGQTDYFTLDVTFDPTIGSASVWVGGAAIATGWSGVASGDPAVVEFGDVDGTSTGSGRYEDVVFLTGSAAMTCSDGVDDDADGAIDFAAGDPDCVALDDPTEDRSDHDGDGLRDGFELAHGFDPLDSDEDTNGRLDGEDDADVDGLANSAEQRAATDPNATDTDLDGLTDAAELLPDGFGTQRVVSTALLGTRSVAVGDLDGDGDADFASASFGSGDFVWFENQDGAGTFGAGIVISNFLSGTHDIDAVDIDRDGDLDLVTASMFDDKIAWYENLDGAGTFGPQLVVTTAANGARSVVASDLDGDGDLDLASASISDHKIAWYENLDGAGLFAAERVVSTFALSAQWVESADLDEDGDQDLVSASGLDDKIAWYENLDGHGSFSSEQIISTVSDGANSVGVADIDGDGRTDVLSTSSADGEIAWYRNLGGGFFGSQQVISTAQQIPYSVAAADLDGDGDLDVAAGSFLDDEVAWYENTNGAGSFGAQQLVSTAANAVYVVRAADIDGDGEVDLVSASSADSKVAWYPGLITANPTLADTDGDQLSDGFEITHGFDPFDPDEDLNGTVDGLDDADVDGLVNASEESAGTNPGLADTDGDTLLDGYEVTFFLDPLDSDENTNSTLDGLDDFESDGLTNAEEQAAGSDPLDPDGDADGVGDLPEVRSLSSDPAASDTDADGLVDGVDNCLTTPNPTQLDFDLDGRGDHCDFNDPLDLADTSTRSVVVQFDERLDPSEVGLTFTEDQLPASFAVNGSLERVITIAGADFEAYLDRSRPFAVAPGSVSDYVLVIDAAGELVSVAWTATIDGTTWTASGSTSSTGGLANVPALAPAPIFCDAVLHGPCDTAIAASAFDSVTGEIAGIGGIDVAAWNGQSAPNDRLNDLADLRLAERAGPTTTIDFEGIAASGQEVLLGAVFATDGFEFDAAYGVDQDFHVLAGDTPGLLLSGTDFGLVTNDSTTVLTEGTGGPFILQSMSLSHLFGGPSSSVTVTGTRFGGATVQQVVPTIGDVWVTASFGSDWTNLSSVEIASTHAFLVMDDVEVVALPEPDAHLMILVSVLGLVWAGRRKVA